MPHSAMSLTPGPVRTNVRPQTMLTCFSCGSIFSARAVIDGRARDLSGRRRCLACLTYRALTRPRRPVLRPRAQKTCESCGVLFETKVVIDGRIHSLYRRRFCLECSPFGAHNTSRTPPGPLTGVELSEHRRKRRNAKAYRYQRKRRRVVKAELVTAHGGRCVDCGYSGSVAALDFHHRVASEKDFAISAFGGAWQKLRAEAAKCDLVCASCHRLRHALEDSAVEAGPVVEHRRGTKVRAVALMGGTCHGCGRDGPAAVFDFHHVDATTKSFGIGQDGIPRRWSRVVAELAKCVMLCANCHREIHAGVRDLDDGLLGLAEGPLPYAA